MIPGLFHLKVPIPDNPLGHTNVYLVKSKEGCLLIDTGWNVDTAWEALVRQLDGAEVSLSDLRYIVITHAHPDHYGLVNRLQHLTPARLVIHEIELASVIARTEQFPDLLDAMGRWLLINGVPEAVIAERLRAYRTLRTPALTMPTFVVRGGEHLKLGDWDIEILWTPGHSDGHICLYERSRRILFAGDHILPLITPNVSLYSKEVGNPLAAYLWALEQVEGLPVDTVFPAHGEVFSGLRERAGDIRRHHDSRVQATLRAVGDGAKTAWEIALEIPWMDDERGWEKLSLIHKCMAVTETLAHLELLRSEGSLGRATQNGVVCYLRASFEGSPDSDLS
jgi:glyoxylase-like metal-dependent hydrolase (beta-lactamase superfamily II)